MSTPVNVTSDTFQAEVLESDLPVIVDFWAPWCGPCKAIGPVLEDVAARYEGKLKVVKVNADEESALTGQFRITGIPTLIAFEGGEPQSSMVGYRGRDPLDQWAAELVGESTDSVRITW
ncbi:MAG: thioredoxin [Myxococcota bacterium]